MANNLKDTEEDIGEVSKREGFITSKEMLDNEFIVGIPYGLDSERMLSKNRYIIAHDGVTENLRAFEKSLFNGGDYKIYSSTLGYFVIYPRCPRVFSFQKRDVEKVLDALNKGYVNLQSKDENISKADNGICDLTLGIIYEYRFYKNSVCVETISGAKAPRGNAIRYKDNYLLPRELSEWGVFYSDDRGDYTTICAPQIRWRDGSYNYTEEPLSNYGITPKNWMSSYENKDIIKAFIYGGISNNTEEVFVFQQSIYDKSQWVMAYNGRSGITPSRVRDARLAIVERENAPDNSCRAKLDVPNILKGHFVYINVVKNYDVCGFICQDEGEIRVIPFVNRGYRSNNIVAVDYGKIPKEYVMEGKQHFALQSQAILSLHGRSFDETHITYTFASPNINISTTDKIINSLYIPIRSARDYPDFYDDSFTTSIRYAYSKSIIAKVISLSLIQGWNCKANDDFCRIQIDSDGDISYCSRKDARKRGEYKPIKMSLGRFVRKLYPDSNWNAVNDKYVEEFVNAIKEQFEPPSFEVVKADEIYNVYTDIDNIVMSSNIAKSCLRSEKKSLFKIFEANSEKVRLVVARDKGGKVVGRALLWTVDYKSTKDNRFVYLMDRIYSSNPIVENHFIKFSMKEGWYRKSRQSHDAKIHLTSPSGEGSSIEVRLDINPFDYESTPYLDTFAYATKDSKGKYYLSNHKTPAATHTLSSLDRKPRPLN